MRVSRASSPRRRQAHHPPETKPKRQPAAPLSIHGLTGVVDAKFSLTIVAPPLRLAPAIPAKAGIQSASASLAIQNQARIAASGSPLPSWERARVRVTPRPSAALRAETPALPGNQTCKPFMGEMARATPRPRSALRANLVPHSSLISLQPPVIPAKAGIQRASASPDIRNQARTAARSPLPS